MPLTDYAVRCTTRECPREASFKVASQWSDGLTAELKTYALCCYECVPARFAEAQGKQAACSLSPGETLAPPEVFALTSHGPQRVADPADSV